MDGPQATPGVLPTGLRFGYLASSAAQLLELAKRELEHGRRGAKAEGEHFLLVGRQPHISQPRNVVVWDRGQRGPQAQRRPSPSKTIRRPRT
jgi:hypothetical protein